MICPFCKNSVKKYDRGYACIAREFGCKFNILNEIGGKSITRSQILMLLNSGRTAIIKNFVGKDGKVFDAVLKVNVAEKKVEFDFPNKIK
jgi:DNA topoisomerase-3